MSMTCFFQPNYKVKDVLSTYNIIPYSFKQEPKKYRSSGIWEAHRMVYSTFAWVIREYLAIFIDSVSSKLFNTLLATLYLIKMLIAQQTIKEKFIIKI